MTALLSRLSAGRIQLIPRSTGCPEEELFILTVQSPRSLSDAPRTAETIARDSSTGPDPCSAAARICDLSSLNAKRVNLEGIPCI